ncbi:hypothetical protein LMH87_012195 [Akanthomyces muscarius]|uniref:Uncharacterized protein n=1 Tax=Akanthomyces muscarius TaxID=2231603 RepID=A0A9W8QCW4_AKAMU|nr:hypothetical protein LMH87_012195 [Akanthomyces muscarius]KAJ4151502.1 hypothetical protein LMH87_012195 [Akanthomyces muscarius]
MLNTGAPTMAVIMGLQLHQCHLLPILRHTRRRATLRCITLPRNRSLMRLLSTIPMVRPRLRAHLSGMGRGSRIMLVADHLAAVITTRVQGVQPDLQMEAAMLSHTHLIPVLINLLLSTTHMEDLLQHSVLSRTTKTRNMGSTHVAAVEGTEMAATVAEVATTTTGALTSPTQIMRS